MAEMTPRQRMLAAYRGELPDTVPVAPEFFSYIPARLLGLDMVEFEKVPHWKALLQTFRHYGTEGSCGVGAFIRAEGVELDVERKDIDNGRVAIKVDIRTPKGDLTRRALKDRQEPGWQTERPVKDLERDWPAYEYWKIGGDPEKIDWRPVRDALAEVGEDFLLEVSLPLQFFDFVALGREGGMERAILDLMTNEEFFRPIHARYLDYVRRYTAAAARDSGGESFYMGCRWSCVSLVGPQFWRKWETEVVRAAAEELHRQGKLMHIHHHGKCLDVLEDLRDCGVDCVCPFERPPGGDVTDLAEARRRLGGRVAVNGNVHTIKTLIQGTPADVRREVAEIFEQWGPDKRRLILGTGDQVGAETPDENIYAMIEAGRELGKCS